jgi:hypothetical protein
VDTRACVRLEPRRNAAVWAMDAWEAMANAMLLVRCVVVRIEVRRRLVSWVQKAKIYSAGVNSTKLNVLQRSSLESRTRDERKQQRK